jgi:hypothetical protein
MAAELNQENLDRKELPEDTTWAESTFNSYQTTETKTIFSNEQDRINQDPRINKHLHPVYWTDSSKTMLASATGDGAVPQAPAVIQELNELLQSDNPRLAGAGAILQNLISSADNDSQNDGHTLLAMLKDPHKKEDALNLIETFALKEKELHQMLSLLENPNKKSLADEIFGLIKSDDTSKSMSGLRLLSLLTHSDKTCQDDGHRLLEMLHDGEKATNAQLLLNRIDDNAKLHKMLELMNQPDQQVAVNQLMKMLQSEETLPGVTRLLDLAKSQYPADIADRDQLLKMLNSNDENERMGAQRLLNLVPDVDYRHTLLQSLSNPDTKRGAQRLLDLIESPVKDQIKSATNLLTLLSSNDTVDQKLAQQLLQFLGGDTKDRFAATTILTQLDDDRSRSRMCDLLASPQYREAAQKLLEDLNGDQTRRAAAKRLLSLAGSPDSNNKDEGSGNSDESKKESKTFNHLMKMLADPAEQRKAHLILNQLSNNVVLDKMVDLLSNPKYKTESQELLNLLESNSIYDKTAVSSVLSMLASPDTNTKSDGESLLQMLADPEQKDSAKLLLSKVTSAKGCHRMLELLKDPANEDTTDTLFNMLKDPAGSVTARRLLESLESPGQFTKALEILQSPSFEQAAVRIKKLLGTETGAKGVAELMEMLNSNREDYYRISAQLTLQDLNNPIEGGEKAFRLLQAGQPQAEMLELRSLLADPATRQVGEFLSEHAREGGHKLLSMLASSDQATAKAAGTLMEMLKHPDQKDLAWSIIRNLGSKEQIQQLVELMETDNGHKGISEIMRLLDSDNTKITALQLLNMLTGSDEADKRTGKQFLQLLSDDNQNNMARNFLINSATREDLREFLKLAFPPEGHSASEAELAKQLHEMLKSSNPAEHAAAVSLTLLSSLGLESGQKIKEMLSDPDKQKDARVMLTQLNPNQYDTLFRLMKADETKDAAAVMLDMLRSGDQKQARGVRSLLNASVRNRTGDIQTKEITKLLGKEETREIAKKALMLVSDDFSLETMSELSSMKDSHNYIQKLAEMHENPETKAAAEALISAGSRNAKTLLDMMNNPKEQANSKLLIGLLQSDEDTKVNAASRLLTMLGSNNASRIETGKQFLNMLTDESRRQDAEQFLELFGEGGLSLMKIMEDKGKQTAANLIKSMLRSDTLALYKLTSLLNSTNALERQEGERILDLLNDRRQQETGLRLLNRKSKQSRVLVF